MERTGYLGPQGSYSHLAAKTLRSQSEAVPYPTFYAVVRALEDGLCDGAVLPIENSINGGVTQNLDLLQQTEGIIATRSCKVNIDHRLACLSGADLGGIKRIYSHSQALEQCGAYLFAHFPDAELKETTSTSASIGMIKSYEDAGIVGAHTVAEGITLSEENIADKKNVFTRFLYVERGGEELCVSSRYVYYSVTCRDCSGALIRLLEPISKYGLNMTKIESRPIKEKVGEYRFFIEIEGDCRDQTVKAALGEVRARSSSFKILGCY